MLSIEFTNTYGDVGRVKNLRIFHPCKRSILQYFRPSLSYHLSLKSLFCLYLSGYELEDNCIQNFQLGRYIVGYTVGNLVLRRRASGAVKRDFRTYIRRYTSPNENFEYSYPHSNALLQFRFKWSVASRVSLKAIHRKVT